MTVYTDNVKNDYVGDGVTTVFPFDFKVFRQEELTVMLDLVPTNAYTASGFGDDGGGQVVFNTAPGVDVNVRLIREMEYHQIIDYSEYDAFPAESHEMGLDRIVMLLQQIGFNLGLVITTSGEEGIVFPPHDPDQYIRWNSDGNNPQLTTGTPVAVTRNDSSDAEAIDGNNQTHLVFNPEQLKLAVEAHVHNLATNPPIVTVASLPGTPDPNTVYLVTT